MKKILLIICAFVPFLSFGQDGTLDQSFGTEGTILESGSYQLAGVGLQTDGKIITCGTTTSTSNGNDFYVARFNANGQLDNSFDADGIATIDFGGKADQAYHLAVQSDGKIVVVGSAKINDKEDIAVTRINPDGTLDNTFGTGGKVTTNIQGAARNIAFKVALQADGKLVIIGTGGSDFFNKNIAIRYSSNGSLDNSFGSNGLVLRVSFASAFTPAELNDIKILDNGKILISGSSSNTPALVRLNGNGTFDSTFNSTARYIHTEMVFGGNRSLLAVQTDGKIIVSYGSATTSELKLLRLSSDGSLDASFGKEGKSIINIGNGNDYATAITSLNNGKIAISGSIYVSSSSTDFFVARLTNSGSLDTEFGSGGFTTTSIEQQEGDRAEGMAIQSDGKIIVAGNRCTGSCRAVLLRYKNSGSTSNLIENNNDIYFKVYPNPATHFITLETIDTSPIISIMLTDINGKMVSIKPEINQNLASISLPELNKGIYLLSVSTAKGYALKKIIID